MRHDPQRVPKTFDSAARRLRVGADGKVTLGAVSCNGSLRRRAEKIVHTAAGVLPIDNRIVSVSSRGPAVSQSVAERYRCNAILAS